MYLTRGVDGLLAVQTIGFWSGLLLVQQPRHVPQRLLQGSSGGHRGVSHYLSLVLSPSSAALQSSLQLKVSGGKFSMKKEPIPWRFLQLSLVCFCWVVVGGDTFCCQFWLATELQRSLPASLYIGGQGPCCWIVTRYIISTVCRCAIIYCFSPSFFLQFFNDVATNRDSWIREEDWFGLFPLRRVKQGSPLSI